jgi:short-subunit dehydrogenase
VANLKGKAVLITGASSGIGEALAREFARRNADVALLARRADRLEKLAKEISDLGARVSWATCDVSEDGAVEAALEKIHKDFSLIDIAIANAGFGVVGNVEYLTLEDYRRQFETNIFGVIRTVQAVLPDLKRTRGRLAVVGSVNGYVALGGNSPYAMSKFAVRALCDSLRFEVKSAGVSVTHIAPGFVTSEIRKVSNKGKYREEARDSVPLWIQMPADKAARKIATATVWRCRERVVTGHGYWVVFLQRHFPRFLSALLHWFKVQARPEPQS